MQLEYRAFRDLVEENVTREVYSNTICHKMDTMIRNKMGILCRREQKEKEKKR